jgi:antitoxin (DNA-binding transcriptional repressor) of toxin-antitoxin stability system
MDNITIAEAKEHLEDLVARARRGETVVISDGVGTVQLSATSASAAPSSRVTDALPPFVPLKRPRTPGRLEGRIPSPPAGFFDPLSEEELKEWYGDDA